MKNTSHITIIENFVKLSANSFVFLIRLKSDIVKKNVERPRGHCSEGRKELIELIFEIKLTPHWAQKEHSVLGGTSTIIHWHWPLCLFGLVLGRPCYSPKGTEPCRSERPTHLPSAAIKGLSARAWDRSRWSSSVHLSAEDTRKFKFNSSNSHSFRCNTHTHTHTQTHELVCFGWSRHLTSDLKKKTQLTQLPLSHAHTHTRTSLLRLKSELDFKLKKNRGGLGHKQIALWTGFKSREKSNWFWRSIWHHIRLKRSTAY